MQRRISWRPAVGIGTPVVMLSLATVVACSDTTRPVQPADEWAETAIQRLQMATDLRVFSDSGLVSLTPQSRVMTANVVAWPVLGEAVPVNAAFSRKPIVRLREQRDSSGASLILAFVHDAPSQPAKRIYAFRNGVIQFIYSANFKQRGKHWVKQNLRVTAFDQGGKPIAQVDQRAIGIPPAGSLALAPSDASIVESELVGEETPLAGCGRQYLDAFAKYLVWAGSLAGGAVVLGGCVVFRAVTPECTSLIAIAGGSLVAFNMYVEALDQLAACEMSEWIQRTNSGGSDDPIGAAPRSGLVGAWIDAAYSFIAAAEASGKVNCNSDGTYCVYYSAEAF